MSLRDDPDSDVFGWNTAVYLRLLDSAGRLRRDGKEGAIPAELAPILERMGLAGEVFMDAVEQFAKYFQRVAGPGR